MHILICEIMSICSISYRTQLRDIAEETILLATITKERLTNLEIHFLSRELSVARINLLMSVDVGIAS